MQIVFEPAARIELREALVWYLEVAGTRQVEAFEQVLDAKLTLLTQHRTWVHQPETTSMHCRC